ncbi:MAG: hypothetical protein WA624_02725 [Methylocella sp.]
MVRSAAVLWNHGGERRSGSLPKPEALFGARVYVLFIPHRSWQGRSPAAYIMDLLNRENGRQRGRKSVESMEARLLDQIAVAII